MDKPYPPQGGVGCGAVTPQRPLVGGLLGTYGGSISVVNAKQALEYGGNCFGSKGVVSLLKGLKGLPQSLERGGTLPFVIPSQDSGQDKWCVLCGCHLSPRVGENGPQTNSVLNPQGG